MSKGAPLGEVAHAIETGSIPGLKKFILGDFNFDKTEKNALTAYFQMIGLEQLVNIPTHIEGRTLDHIYVPNQWKDSMNIFPQYKYYSDHVSLSVEMI